MAGGWEGGWEDSSNTYLRYRVVTPEVETGVEGAGWGSSGGGFVIAGQCHSPVRVVEDSLSAGVCVNTAGIDHQSSVNSLTTLSKIHDVSRHMSSYITAYLHIYVHEDDYLSDRLFSLKLKIT